MHCLVCFPKTVTDTVQSTCLSKCNLDSCLRFPSEEFVLRRQASILHEVQNLHLPSCCSFHTWSCLQVWPYFEAERTACRFRVVDASNYRTYNLTFVCAAPQDYPYFYLFLRGSIVPFTQVSALSRQELHYTRSVRSLTCTGQCCTCCSMKVDRWLSAFNFQTFLIVASRTCVHFLWLTVDVAGSPCLETLCGISIQYMALLLVSMALTVQ